MEFIHAGGPKGIIERRCQHDFGALDLAQELAEDYGKDEFSDMGEHAAAASAYYLAYQIQDKNVTQRDASERFLKRVSHSTISKYYKEIRDYHA